MPNLITIQPRMIILLISWLLIVVVCLEQFRYLLNEYWQINQRISKGPLIWLVCLAVIYKNIYVSRWKNFTANLDLIFITVATFVLAFCLSYIPIAAPVLLVVIVWYLLSDSVNFDRLIIVFLFLLLSLPFYSEMGGYLRSLTVLVTEGFIVSFGIPILVQEFYIAIPEGTFYVENGCSGFRVMTINLILLFLYSLLSNFNFIQFGAALLVAILIALLANWIRVIAVILIAHNFGIDNNLVRDHAGFGWLLFAMLLVPFFYFLLIIDRDLKSKFNRYNRSDNLVFKINPIIFSIPSLLLVFWQQWL